MDRDVRAFSLKPQIKQSNLEVLKLEMELIMPMSNSVIDATPTKITLQYKKDVISSDVADNIGKHKKSYLVRELGLNFKC